MGLVRLGLVLIEAIIGDTLHILLVQEVGKEAKASLVSSMLCRSSASFRLTLKLSHVTLLERKGND